MDDLISRQAAIDALCDLYEYQRIIDPTEAADLVRQGVFLAEKKIENLPSAQPEIIRCKDCKWSDWYDVDGHKYCYCIETGASRRTADDFCSYAERETEPYRGEQE